jgi:RHS repeat-associated protein
VFGDVRASSGTPSLFGYTGEQRDPTTGFTHLRARDYDPAMGRFTARDTVQPNAEGTQGFNRYGYVADNPCSATDPSGYFSSQFGVVMECWNVVEKLSIGFGLAIAALRFFVGFWPIALAATLAAALFAAFIIVAVFICLQLTLEWIVGQLNGLSYDAQSPNGNGPQSPPDLLGAPADWPTPPSI